MRRGTAAFLTILTLAAAPAVAAAQEPPPGQTTPGPPPVTTPPPATPPATPPPAPGKLTIKGQRVGGARSEVLAGDRFLVRGTVAPFVDGQTVVVRLYHGKRKLTAVGVTVRPSVDGTTGRFVVGLRTSTTGRVTIRASHRASAQQATMVARPLHVSVLATSAALGARGPVVRLLQRRLRALHYVVGQDGVFDDRTARAVLAFRKVTGLPRLLTADRAVFRRLGAGTGRFHVRHPSHGRHVEASLSKQVLALVLPGGRVDGIYPMSSGKPSTPSVLGSFRVYLKTPGTNEKGMFFSSYFVRGYAIHGYVDVPTFAASHGCLRVPAPDAVPIYDWLRIGDIVDVYR
jgi:hypothetical protein